MAEIPTTSTTLLRDIAHDSQHARWSEFVTRYHPMMEAFLRERFPTLEADDIIQDTLVAICTALPSYRYVPDEKGHFHNYLTGILRNKALRQLHKEQRQAEIADEMRRSRGDAPYQTGDSGRAGGSLPAEYATDEKSWREALLEVALQQLLNDDSIHSRTRQVFLRVAVNGERPADVAAAFGIERNAVDQIKNRMMIRLRELVAALEKVDGA
jgi:RNA polymerase sigma factor (sigma-70 family)